MKTLYPVPVTNKPEQEGEYITDKGDSLYAKGKWYKVKHYAGGDKSTYEIQVEYWYTDQPPTAQQATSKSMKIHSTSIRDKKLNGVPSSVPYGMLSESQAQTNHDQSLDRLNERGGLGVLEVLDNIHMRKLSIRNEMQADVDELNELIAKYQQPHPQDSSSGEVDLATQIQNLYKQLPECSLKDHMGKWFSYQGTNPLYNQVPPASESLEQTAKSFLMDRINKHCVVSTGGRLIMLSNPLTADIIVEWIVEFATQQQKPLAVVLPDENDFMLWFKEMKYDRKTFDFAKSIWNEAVKKLSAANGVDPVKLVEWACGLGLYQAVSGNWNKIDDPFKVVYETTQELLKDYITEQSQQQNKGK